TVPYWMAQLGEPREMASSEILMLTGSEHFYNVAVSGTDMEDTYYYEETYDQDTGRQISIDAWFGALEIGKDLWILVRSDEEINRRDEDYVGTLQPISDSVAQDVLELSADELDIEYLPIMLDITEDETMWYVGTITLIILALIALWALFSSIQRGGDPAKHPIMKKLARLGNVDDVVHSVEKDISLGTEDIGKLRLTRSFIVYETNYDVIPYDKLAWVYKFIRKGKYGIKTYEAHLYDVTGHQMTIVGKQEQVDQMLHAVLSRAPWAIAGYNDNIKRTWNKERDTFIAEVDKRHSEYKLNH
ncbi:MAG: DUF6709 family protein, partial [Chloroflexota bacterium]